jgi:hypothetical protein
MYIFATIMSSLALLAALAGIALLIYEKKCSKKRNTALMQYVDSVCASCSGNVDAMLQVLREQTGILSGKVKDLEGGIVPDFEKAKAAADAVNNFNAGISGILGFDPHEVLKKQRNDGGD